MERPDNLLMAMRPLLQLTPIDDSNGPEHFQNTVLRPILKLQHHIVLKVVVTHQTFNSIKVASMTQQEFLRSLTVMIQGDTKLRNQLIGIIIGMMTLTELDIYMGNASEFNRRIIQMAAQRVADTVWI
jgi:hypothetical protein